MDTKDDQAKRCRVEREENSMSGFRPKRLLLYFIAFAAVLGAFAVQAHAWLLAPSPESDIVRAADKDLFAKVQEAVKDFTGSPEAAAIRQKWESPMDPKAQ